MTPADLTTWLTKQQAADVIGVSTKAIERFTQAGKLEQAFRQQAGSPPVAVYFPDDVARIASTRRPGRSTGFLVPDPTPAPRNGHGQPGRGVAEATPASLMTIGSGEELLRVLVAAATHLVSQTSQTPTLYLTLAEASAVSGLSQAYLKRAIEAKRLEAVRDRGWRIRRTDLEAL